MSTSYRRVLVGAIALVFALGLGLGYWGGWWFNRKLLSPEEYRALVKDNPDVLRAFEAGLARGEDTGFNKCRLSYAPRVESFRRMALSEKGARENFQKKLNACREELEREK